MRTEPATTCFLLALLVCKALIAVAPHAFRLADKEVNRYSINQGTIMKNYSAAIRHAFLKRLSAAFG
jgi:hypothetical protein